MSKKRVGGGQRKARGAHWSRPPRPTRPPPAAAFPVNPFVRPVRSFQERAPKSTREIGTRRSGGRVSAAQPVAVGPVPGQRPRAASAAIPAGGHRPPDMRLLRSNDATRRVEAAEFAAATESGIGAIVPPTHASLIGTAVRGVTHYHGAVTYVEVVEYHPKSNRFLVRYRREEGGGDERDDETYYAYNTHEEVIRNRVSRDRTDDEVFDMDAQFCLPCDAKTLWVLDVFSCLQSVKRGLDDLLEDYKKRGWTVHVVHLDIDRRREPDVLCDVRDWKNELVDDLGFGPLDFHIIWMSPDCRFFSPAGHPSAADVQHSVELVSAARELCEFFRPICFFLENPWSGGRCLRKQDVASDLLEFHVECCYCMYSEDGMKKPTSIFTNVPNIVLEYCCAANPCHWLKQGHTKHRRSAQRGRSASGTPGSPLNMAIVVPKGLMVILLDAALRHITVNRKRWVKARGALRGIEWHGRSRGQRLWARRREAE